MLPKKNRLTRKEILKLKGKREILQFRFWGLIYSPAKGRKFGLIISQKVAPKAVERNRVKRLLYRAIEEGFPNFGFFLFLAKKTILTASLEELKKELELLNGRIK
ncbi:MAG: ribonuclease P protein component [Patescibacteria group bacterium]|nr:ribonuclease P protein component [Patescibacteria group bacterium]